MIGCGAISRAYSNTARRLDAIEIVAAADRVPARATAVEAAEGIPAMPVADLLAKAGEVDVVLNDDPGRPRRHRPPGDCRGQGGLRREAAGSDDSGGALDPRGCRGDRRAGRLRAGHGPGGRGSRCRKAVDDGRIGADPTVTKNRQKHRQLLGGHQSLIAAPRTQPLKMGGRPCQCRNPNHSHPG